MRILRLLMLAAALALGANATCLAQVNPIPWAQSPYPAPGYFAQIASNSVLTVLNSGSATACTSLEVNSNARLVALVNAAAAQTATLSVYDEGASPTCAAADLRYSVILGAGAITILNLPFFNGVAYTLSAAATGNILLYRL